MTQFCRQWAIITGCSSGIGAALAIRLSSLNYHVLAIGRREKRLVETKQQGNADKIHPLRADIGIPSEWDRIESFIPKNAGNKIKFLIHNAAVGDPDFLENIDLDHWNYAMAVNVTAPLFLTQKFIGRLNE